jgi:hypothetical protein
MLDRMQPGSPRYNEPAALRLRSPLDAAVLSQALDECVRRHEALRTRFVTVAKGEPAQLVDPPATIPMPVVDLSELAPSAREAELTRRIAVEVQRPFELTRAPLLRATLFRLDAREHVLLAVTHHIVSDGWSIGVFERELAQLYVAFRGKRPSPLPELPIQYADFASWHRRWLADGRVTAQLEYWKAQLRGAPPLLELPTDRPRPRLRKGAGRRRAFVLSAEAVARYSVLRRVCAGNRAWKIRAR